MRKISPLILFLIIFPLFSQIAHGCSGGFFGPYPRTIVTAPAESGSPEQARLLSVGGRDWRIPTPAGLFDLEILTKATLPSDEEFKALAFSLGSNVVFFTDFSGQGSWPENKVPIEASMMFRQIKTPAESGPGRTDLTPEARQSLVDFLEGGAEHLSRLVPDEMYDRAKPDLWLLRSPEHDGQYKELYVTFNYNQGKSLDDSLVFFQKFNAFDQSLLFSYSVPLQRYPIPPETLARLTRDTEAAFEQWLTRFCALNEIEAPGISWQ